MVIATLTAAMLASKPRSWEGSLEIVTVRTTEPSQNLTFLTSSWCTVAGKC